jgi:hypothetical protein
MEKNMACLIGGHVPNCDNEPHLQAHCEYCNVKMFWNEHTEQEEWKAEDGGFVREEGDPV